MKSNSQPTVPSFTDIKEVFPKNSARTKSIVFDDLSSSKGTKKMLESPITQKINELKFKFLRTNESTHKAGKQNTNKTLIKKPNQKFQFININPILSKENSIGRRIEPNPNLSSRIRSDHIRKKFDDIIMDKSPTLKSSENYKLLQNVKENRVKAVDSVYQGERDVNIDPHKQKIEDKKLYLLKMLSV